jgi:hypothetical protein
MYILNLIIKTNGDLLGFFLFLGLIIYFINIIDKTPYELFLMICCVIALIVDFITIITSI